MSDQNEMVSPFSSGTSYMIWRSSNCDNCAKDWDPNSLDPNAKPCDIEEAISLASVSEGVILKQIWKRAGEGKTKCPEFSKCADVAPVPVSDGYKNYDASGREFLSNHWQTVDGKKRLVF